MKKKKYCVTEECVDPFLHSRDKNRNPESSNCGPPTKMCGNASYSAQSIQQVKHITPSSMCADGVRPAEPEWAARECPC